MVTIYNEFMSPGPGIRLDRGVKSALPDFGGIYGVVLLIKDADRFETLYILSAHVEDPLKQVRGLEERINFYLSSHLPPEQMLPGDRGMRFTQTQLDAMRRIARPYVNERNYHLIVANPELWGLIDSYVNPPTL